MSVLADWNARHLVRYAEQVERGEHDQDCEQRERSTLCHCSKRRRERDGKTDLPEIYFAAPVCAGCNDDVEFDGDTFTCPTCRVAWGRSPGDGDKATHFTDDYGSGSWGGEQFGRRLLTIVEVAS